ncbi:hypothetical protein GOBAR_DD04496 [Gossypium barbadense]|nr:hypothetical protein GOBAR_DD04496 [Gossypium barbadense]
MNLKFCILFSFFVRNVIARGGYRSTSLSSAADLGFENESYAGSGRHLIEENQSHHPRSCYYRTDIARGYMTNSELERAVKEFGRRCSHISRIYSIGESVRGFPLWVIEISDKPGREEPEPAFKFIGNVHGDEPVGRELLLLLANWICDNYKRDPLLFLRHFRDTPVTPWSLEEVVDLIVDKVHLHILPSMNPDGFSFRRRGNANNVDLNRDFPDQGALVANYPWDASLDKRKNYYACPDDGTFRFLASIYSKSHYNMSLSKEFEGGITNGAAWYPVYGGMQDWNYIYGGCFELTLEISDNKWPNAKELPTIWEYNKMSMLNLVASLVKTGVHGRVFSSDSGRPLPGLITIKGINYTVKTSGTLADYHRLLVPGERYEVMATVPGYKSKATHIWLEKEEATNVDFILDPEVSSDGTLLRSICDCGRKSRLLSIGYFWGTHFEVYLVLIVVLAFLCFLLTRRIKSNLLKQRSPPKRSVLTV